MLAPIVACALAMGALGWFGLHVLQRGIIFVDLALAQVAALGATYAVFLGHEPDSTFALGLSLGFTLLGALAFASIRTFEDRVPQEALIGIAYAVSAALGVLLIELAADPHGAEKLQHLMVGNIVWVRWDEIGRAAVALVLMGGLHLALGRRFLQVSVDPAGAAQRGLRVALWDLLFYASFGVVITAIVPIIGVLLVFSFLVIPAVIGRLLAQGIGARLGIAYGVGLGASVWGVAISYEHSTGPIVVALLGLALVLTLAVVAIRTAPRPGRRAVALAGAGLGLGLLLWGAGHLAPEGTEAHGHTEHAVADHPHEAHHEEHAQAHAHQDPVPGSAGVPQSDPLSRLEQAVLRAREGDPAGLGELAALVQVDAPFIRMEAADRLQLLAGPSAPTYDPLAGPDAAGLWAAWAQAPPADWTQRAPGLTLP